MKKRIVLFIVVLAVLLTLFASCDKTTDNKYTLKKLATPVVVIDEDGVASWNAVENASKYDVMVDTKLTRTQNRSIELTIGQTIKVRAVGDNKTYKDSDYSEELTYRINDNHGSDDPNKDKPDPEKPIYTSVKDIIRLGNELETGATGTEYYYVKVKITTVHDSMYGNLWTSDGTGELFIYGCYTQDGVRYDAMTEKEKPVVGDEIVLYGQITSFINSYGNTMIEIKNAVLIERNSTVVAIQLAKPIVRLDSEGKVSWGAVANAIKYAYEINGTTADTTDLYVILAEGETFKVKAVGDGTNYIDSEFSTVITYNPSHGDDPSDHSHTDNDDNGVCDTCYENLMQSINFYAINDLHGKYMDTATQPGVDEFSATMKKWYNDDSEYEVLLSSGDMWQGTVESSTNKGRLMTEWMNELDFVSMTLGNHEYDWGNDGLSDIATLAEFPLLAINVRVNGIMPDYCKSSVVVERGGVKIGIIGAIGNCLSSISGEFTSNLYFVTGYSLTSLVKAEATKLRSEGCKFIVYSIHDGYGSGTSGVLNVTSSDISSYYDTSLSNGYIDLVFEGHTHQNYILQDEYGVYHLQGGGENTAISVASLYINSVTGTFTVNNVSKMSSYVYGDSSLEDDPAVQEIFNRYFPDENPYTTVVGYLSSEKNDTDICDTLASLYLQKGIETWGNEYEIVLGGGYLKTRSPYKLTMGNTTYSQIFSVLPFDNTIILGSIKGTYLKSKFINTTNRTYHCAYDQNIVSSISDNATYYIIVDSYTAYYSYNNITVVKRLEGVYPRDLLKEYIAGGNWDDRGDTVIEYTDISEILQIGNTLEDNEVTTQYYYINVAVKSIVSTTYGNMYVYDSTGELYVYGCYTQDGKRYDAMSDWEKPTVGSQIVLYGKITKYVNGSTVIIEMKSAILIEE